MVGCKVTMPTENHMPIKIFSAPGDFRDDFANAEDQFNESEKEVGPNITDIRTTVNHIPGRENNAYVLTIVVHYERG